MMDDNVREALASLLSAHAYDGGHGLMSGEQFAAMVREELEAILDAFEVRPRGTVTEAEVEAAAKAMFEDGTGLPGDYTWAQMVAEDPTRADIWRADARAVLEAARDSSETAFEKHVRQYTEAGW